jgi:hypothetical protein
MTVATPGGMTAERFAALPLSEQFRLVAAERVRRGLTPYDYGQSSFGEGAEAVRESASLSDMPNILGNNIYREIDQWFSQYDAVWQQYARPVMLTDYRPKVLAFIQRLEQALEIRQERDIQDSSISDKGYQVSLKNWGRQITLPFVVIENDDKDFVAQIPAMMTEAAEFTMSVIVVRNTLEANPNAYDGAALFTAGRGNLITGAGSALSAANVQTGISTVQSATGDADLNPRGGPLNIQPRYLVVPTTLQFTAAQILNSTTLIMAGTAGTVTVQGNVNPLTAQGLGYQAPLTPLVDRYLTNTTAWYILPDAKNSPIAVAERQGKGLRPNMWKNVPMRQAIRGSQQDYLLSISDVVYGFSFDLNATARAPWSSFKAAGA